MLKGNSKQLKENIRNYIVTHYEGPDAGYDNAPERTTDFNEIARFILDNFRKEKMYIHGWERDVFIDWCQGLPSLLDTCYYYNRSAVDDLGDILEETTEERSRYTEEQAAERLTLYIYRELQSGEKNR